MAVNCLDRPLFVEADAGVTAIAVRGMFATVIVRCPDTPPDFAVIVHTPVPTAVSTPDEALMVAMRFVEPS